MDRQGNIGIGYSFGGGDNYAGQRFAARSEIAFFRLPAWRGARANLFSISRAASATEP